MKQYLKEYVRPQESVNNRREGSWRSRGVNFTVKQYDEMFLAQKGLCAICNKKKKLHVDHNHDTGNVRGLLCDYCNRILLIKNNTADIFRKAADYLEKDTPAA